MIPNRQLDPLQSESPLHTTKSMKQNNRSSIPSATAVVLAITASVYAGDYSPTSPVRPSAGLLNDWLRKDNPYMSAWDIGTQVRLRYEIRDNFGIAGKAGS